MAIITNYSKASGDIYFHHTVSEKTQDTPLLYGPESHRGFEIIYLVEGEVRYFIEGEEYLETFCANNPDAAVSVQKIANYCTYEYEK